MDQNDVFENKKRKLLLDYIICNPGVTFQLLRKTMGFSQSTLRYHLDILKKNELIIERKDRNQRVYVSIEGRAEKDRISILKDRMKQNNEVVMELIKNNPGIGRKELMQRSGENRRSLSVILHRLRKEGFIMKMKDNDVKGYKILEQRKLHDEMVIILIEKYLLKEISLKELISWKKKIDEMI